MTMSWALRVLVGLILPLGSGILLYEPGCTWQHNERDTKATCTGYNITEVPQWLPVNTTKMSMSGTAIRTVRVGAFSRYTRLTELFFRDTTFEPCQLEYIQPGVFDGLDFLEAIGMVGCLSLHALERGVLGRFKKLKMIQIYRSGLTSVPDVSMLQAENIDVDGLIQEIDLHNNRIETIKKNDFSGIIATNINLADNLLTAIDSHAFQNSTIAHLNINTNPTLSMIGTNAFAGIKSLMELDMSRTGITNLPTNGLGQLKTLLLRDTPQLKKFPSVLEFSHIEKAELYYPHHCCAFKNPEKQNPALWQIQTRQFQEKINAKCSKTTPTATTSKPWLVTHTSPQFYGFSSIPVRYKRDFLPLDPNLTDTGSDTDGIAPQFGIFGTNPIEGGIHQHEMGNFMNESVRDDINTTQSVSCGNIFIYNMNITCTPAPDAFNPCEDVMGYEWLRVTVWFVLLAALLGNFIVFTILVTSRGKITVSKFLMCNLAFADFLMGVYLLILASIDIHTLGEYFNYAVLWQNEGGCQVAGFLTVFSSELSIYTLTIITLERWYTIRYAMHLNKRIKIRHALVLMTLGYVFAVVLAVLPLFGISGYGNVSICLPMKAEDGVDIGYVVSLLVMNGLMFLAICFCYINMYWKVKGSDSTVRNNDATIAKRMALLVFTNFACWAPIAFFGLTASAGAPLIDITNSKILLVFFYPLNSCANPFLYAILTKQFRKDVFIILGKYGVCVEKANSYRGTYISRSMSQSRGGKDVALHSMAHNHESTLFSQFLESNISAKISMNSTPKVHPSTQCGTISSSFKGRSAGHSREWASSNGTTSTGGTDRSCPPYVRSVSDYISLGARKGSLKRSAPKHQISIETYISNSTDTTYASETSHGASEDIWKIREEVEDREVFKQKEICKEGVVCSGRKMKPFTCDIYSTDDEMRISHQNCYTIHRDSDFDDDDVFHHLLSEQSISTLSSGNTDISASKTSFTHSNASKYKFARSPSLSSLEENSELCVSQNSPYCERSSESTNDNQRDGVCVEESFKGDHCVEANFHRPVTLQRNVTYL